MSKKSRNERQQERLAAQNQGAAPELRPVNTSADQTAAIQPVPIPEAAEPQTAPRDGKYFVIFWGIIILSAAAAWILAILLPNVSESIIERWIMAALAVSLAVFLFFYK